MKKLQKNLIKQKNVLLNKAYNSLLIDSLLFRAKNDNGFALKMYSELKGREVDSGNLLEKFDSFVEYISPSSDDMALRRLDYILKEESKNLDLSPLFSWVDIFENEQSKNIVVGIIGMAIPGPTLGMLKRKNPMNFLIKTKNLSQAAIMKISLESGISLVANCIKDKKSDASRLEPEIYDWFFGDRELAFYTVNDSLINKYKKITETYNIAHNSISLNGGVVGLAISPVLSREFFSELDEINLD